MNVIEIKEFDRKVKRLTKKLIKIVKKSTKIYVNKTYKEAVESHKFLNDDVTNLDLKTQKYIMEKCLKLLPESSFVGEEGTKAGRGDWTFIVDPIDGTLNFKHNIKNYGTQLCLLYKNQPAISVLYMPNEKAVYYANKFGSFKNNSKITVSNITSFEEAVAAFGDFSFYPDFIKTQQEHMKILSENFKRIRMFGSSCVDNCMLAGGNIDAYVIHSNNSWDLLPGHFLVEQAGGVVFSNKEGNIHISGNREIVDSLKKLLNL